MFRGHGFKIVYPETLRFEDQVALYAQADAVAGISGSGLHNSVFMRPGAATLELGDPRYGGSPAPTQALCDSISGVSPTFIPFTGRRFGPRGTMLFDISFLRHQLDLVLGPGNAKPPSRGSLWTRLSQLLEIAYLCVRPLGGALLRQTIRRFRGVR